MRGHVMERDECYCPALLRLKSCNFHAQRHTTMMYGTHSAHRCEQASTLKMFRTLQMSAAINFHKHNDIKSIQTILLSSTAPTIQQHPSTSRLLNSCASSSTTHSLQYNRCMNLSPVVTACLSPLRIHPSFSPNHVQPTTPFYLCP
ncbi:hypothetical protein VFPPC_15748 [Pochonia chlamydosporia 170]|uniref:Uncharacterized protein n=1 Tax=Pochonia chlamydosporia 170 TaxID=1380566 RepID=A0A179FQI5_METCM|nr:hypothetical protein VFPPC_15748 [Pochonia chlamydosporia 170]OAQ67885.1 hypothetical protein VFPPC_15748 [Pochonia chlamydosporia 170]